MSNMIVYWEYAIEAIYEGRGVFLGGLNSIDGKQYRIITLPKCITIFYGTDNIP